MVGGLVSTISVNTGSVCVGVWVKTRPSIVSVSEMLFLCYSKELVILAAVHSTVAYTYKTRRIKDHINTVDAIITIGPEYVR